MARGRCCRHTALVVVAFVAVASSSSSSSSASAAHAHAQLEAQATSVSVPAICKPPLPLMQTLRIRGGGADCDSNNDDGGQAECGPANSHACTNDNACSNSISIGSSKRKRRRLSLTAIAAAMPWDHHRSLPSRYSADDRDDRGLSQAVQHQLEHRAKEKASLKLGEKAATQILRSRPRWLGRFWDSWSRLWRHVGSSPAGRVGERTGENLFAARHARMGQRVLTKTEGRFATGLASRSAPRAGEAVASGTATAALSPPTARAVRRTVAGHLAEVVGERTAAAPQTGTRPMMRTATATAGVGGGAAERMVRSASRASLIALPALGGFFALWLLRSDVRRFLDVREEREEYEWRINTTSTSSSTTSTPRRFLGMKMPALPRCGGTELLFGGAAAADLLDAVAHFVLAYAVLIEVGGHGPTGDNVVIARWEELTVLCAVVSTVLAVAGEIADHRRRQRVQAASGGY